MVVPGHNAGRRPVCSCESEQTSNPGYREGGSSTTGTRDGMVGGEGLHLISRLRAIRRECGGSPKAIGALDGPSILQHLFSLSNMGKTWRVADSHGSFVSTKLPRLQSGYTCPHHQHSTTWFPAALALPGRSLRTPHPALPTNERTAARAWNCFSSHGKDSHVPKCLNPQVGSALPNTSLVT